MTARVPLADDAVLLFPGDDARPLDAWTRPPSQLVVLDGTWTQVKRLRHDNPWLHDLPLLGLSPTTPSRYRIREEPAAHCLSTLEAVALVLRAWEPDSTAPAELLAAFEGMVDRHLAAERPARARHKARRRASLMQRLADLDDVVVVYAEEVGRQQGQPRLLQWAAVRPASGEVFDQLVSLPVANPCVRASMGLADEPADGSLRALASAWRRWRRPGAPAPAHRRRTPHPRAPEAAAGWPLPRPGGPRTRRAARTPWASPPRGRRSRGRGSGRPAG